MSALQDELARAVGVIADAASERGSYRAFLRSLFPDSGMYRSFEMHPCKVLFTDANGREHVARCSPGEATFWSVYGVLPGGMVEALVDRTDRDDAANFLAAFREKLQ